MIISYMSKNKTQPDTSCSDPWFFGFGHFLTSFVGQVGTVIRLIFFTCIVLVRFIFRHIKLPHYSK